ncbi:PhzF family phenazine biosynthesis protein [Clostridium sp. 'deep sea']|uniref:PhzF family phenazine biosynthesis protein n=1 Tax=Clostridium sp. 'deep sea' TaxID=2779445 RepID=UPI00189674E8|nr:PhzF family phenazine biosynthesis protein [Clostridium sp. 'deep sea']QOR35305.1 PhzF family phenazine biosynthesis protein [Clostridium sp. 'deep sea']
MDYYIVNSFAKESFRGNPAAVVLVKQFPKTKLMQSIAKQLNLVETVFIKVINKSKIEIKYFTPLKQLPIAGHPTIAGLKVLYEQKLINEGSIDVLTDTSYYVAFVRNNNNNIIYSLSFNEIKHKEVLTNKELVANVLSINANDLQTNLPVKVVDSGLGHIIVPVVSLEALNRVKRNIGKLKQLCNDYNAREAQIFTYETISKNNDLHTRNICPREGVEDPACGVGNAALLSYLAKESQALNTYKIEQGYINNFQSLIIGSVTKDQRVLIGGNAIIMGKGEIYV